MDRQTGQLHIHILMLKKKLILLKCFSLYKFRKCHKSLAIEILKQSYRTCHNSEEQND